MPFAPQVQKIQFQGAEYSVWRDDLHELVPGEPALGGNKARKLYYYLNREFAGIDTLVSYGSVQSNMLYSLSVLANIKGWDFNFYVQHIPKNLAESPRGNYHRAIKNGAKIEPLGNGNIRARVERLVGGRSSVLYIPEGGCSRESEPGIALLAKEINQWVDHQALQKPRLMLPSGTGTMAFYLQKHLSIEVLTCACVGDSGYLEEQLMALGPGDRLPTILPTKGKYHFGRLYPEFYQIWQELKAETNIEFDLLYDPLGWLTMLDYRQRNPEVDLIYLHQGGQLGNQTMLERYRRKRLE